MASYGTMKGLVALVTGGASGLGRATAERFIREGAKVVLCDLPTSKGHEVAQELGEQCAYKPIDVTSEKDVKDALHFTETKFKRLNVLVNCAGISVAFKMYNFLKDRPHVLSDLQKVLKTNCFGTLNVIQNAVDLMAKNECDEHGQRGIVVNTSGSSAFEGLLGQVAYSASASSIALSTQPLAQEYSSQGIRVCTIAPGYIHTPLFDTLPENLIDFIGQNTPSPKRLGKPDEFASLVQLIVENPMMNGEVIRLDGGCRMSL